MRIISGKYGSRRIKAKIPDNVRPTSDRVRESMFNSILNLIDVEGLNVLDLFAGTGALGFESLSRGAEKCVFVEKNKKSTEIIRNVAIDLKISNDDFFIINSDVIKYLKNTKVELKFDLVFADPPYDDKVYEELLEILPNCKNLTDSCLIIIEYRSNFNLSVNNRLKLITSKEFGDTSYNIYEMNH